MSQFIKLTNTLINKKIITSIQVEPTKYHIFTNIQTNMYGVGVTKTQYLTYEICKDTSPTDYEIVQCWIDGMGYY